MTSDPEQKRKVTYCLYPTPRQSELLSALLRHRQQLYNAALEERISAWQKAGKSISCADQFSSLTTLRSELPEWAQANRSSQHRSAVSSQKDCQSPETAFIASC
jgi:putative transposase